MLEQYNCLIAQSGGPTAAINASLAGIISRALYYHTNGAKINRIYGSLHGIQGVLSETLIDLTDIFLSEPEKIETLKYSPSMYLGSCRYKLPDYTTESSDYTEICNILQKYQIKYFFYIGGNDSMDTVAKLSGYIKHICMDVKVIGIPKTIDNDLACTDHTPGFGSAAKYIATSLLEIAHDTSIYDLKSVVIAEIMGRNAGWLTAASALARNSYNTAPHLIYLPECPFSEQDFLSEVSKQLEQRNHVIIAVSEGIKDNNGNYISAKGSKKDKFGHVMLCGTGRVLEELVSEHFSCKVRSIELNVLQRSASHIASLTDINESFILGEQGVEQAISGKSGVMITSIRTSNFPYRIEYSVSSIDTIANLEKKVPRKWIHENGTDITEEFLEYLRPLILGEVPLHYKDGLPMYLSLKHI